MEANEKTKKNGLSKFIVILIIVLALILTIGFALARYVTSLKGYTEAQIAQWSFIVNGKTNENFTINLAETRKGVEQEAEVADDYIGPGTAGKFNIVIDARDCEVSLEYEVNMDVGNGDNTKFPKNLIFYSDDKMENAIFHEGNTINFNGFIGQNYEEEEKLITIPIFWKWAYITGSTPEEQKVNDKLDTYWMGKPPTSFEINVIGKQVDKNPISGQYAVTFDANGGTLQGYGNSSQASKQVTYGEEYGELPVPSREGYRFVGWNGKNLVNIANQNINIINDYYKQTASSPKYTLRPNTTYTLSFDYKINEATEALIASVGYGSEYYAKGIGESIAYSNLSKKVVCTVTTPSSFIYSPPYVWFRLVRMVSPGDANVDISNVQFEEGEIATEYEPYFVAPITKVTQAKNHTLTAIWVKE